MTATRHYMAGWVPRFMRLARLGHLPLDCVICSQTARRGDGQNVAMDLLMMPAQEFKLMQSHVGLQHVISPALNMGKGFEPVYAMKDIKQVAVPENEQDPRTYAREYFLAAFGVLTPSESRRIDGDKE